MTECYGNASIEPYGIVKLGKKTIIEFSTGMAFINGTDGVAAQRGFELIANYVNDITLLPDNEQDCSIAVLISGRDGIRFTSGVAFQLFCKSLVYTENG